MVLQAVSAHGAVVDREIDASLVRLTVVKCAYAFVVAVGLIQTPADAVHADVRLGAFVPVVAGSLLGKEPRLAIIGVRPCADALSGCALVRDIRAVGCSSGHAFTRQARVPGGAAIRVRVARHTVGQVPDVLTEAEVRVAGIRGAQKAVVAQHFPVLIGLPVAVVVDSIADFGFRRQAQARYRLAHTLGAAGATPELVVQRTWVSIQAVIYLAVTIIVEPVAQLGHALPRYRVADHRSVEADEESLGRALALSRHTGRSQLRPGVVRRAVAVVVHTVTQLGLRSIANALACSCDAAIGSLAGTVLVIDCAWLAVQVLVG